MTPIVISPTYMYNEPDRARLCRIARKVPVTSCPLVQRSPDPKSDGVLRACDHNEGTRREGDGGG